MWSRTRTSVIRTVNCSNDARSNRVSWLKSSRKTGATNKDHIISRARSNEHEVNKESKIQDAASPEGFLWLLIRSYCLLQPEQPASANRIELRNVNRPSPLPTQTRIQTFQWNRFISNNVRAKTMTVLYISVTLSTGTVHLAPIIWTGHCTKNHKMLSNFSRSFFPSAANRNRNGTSGWTILCLADVKGLIAQFLDIFIILRKLLEAFAKIPLVFYFSLFSFTQFFFRNFSCEFEHSSICSTMSQDTRHTELPDLCLPYNISSCR